MLIYIYTKAKGENMTNTTNLVVQKQNLNIAEKISSFFKRAFLPTRLTFNSLQVAIKRRAVIRTYKQYMELSEVDQMAKKEKYAKKFDETYSQYLEMIDKYIMDNIFKKLKVGKASEYEKEVLSNYHKISMYKSEEYIEYKLKKQKFLLELDYRSQEENNPYKMNEDYKKIYLEKQDKIYKGLLKNYSVKITDDRVNKKSTKLDVYLNIFETIEEYLNKIIPLKFEIEGKDKYREILKEYDKFQHYSIGKLDEKAFLEKSMILLSISRTLFTHSLPLIVAEQCYEKLLKDTRYLLMNSKNEDKKKKAYSMLQMLIKEYYIKLLAIKIYWEDKNERNLCKKFIDNFNKAKTEEKKEVLILKEELRRLKKDNINNMDELKKWYKAKLSELRIYENNIRYKQKI